MKKYIFFIFLLSLFFIKLDAFAQVNVLNGSWYSSGVVKIEGTTNNYLGELKLQQNGRNVTGFFNYYFRDSLFTNKIVGIFDLTSRYLVINPFPIMLHQSTSTKIGVDCQMGGEFLLRMSRVGSFLAGSFKASPAYKYTCPDIQFSFEKGTDDVNPIEEAKQASIAKAKDSIDPIAAAIQKDFENRPKEFFKEIIIDSKTVDIELYDNGAIDNDSVSIFLNNKLMLKKTMLTHIAIKLTLQMDEKAPFNEVSMFANNVGFIPPNTATLILIDGDNRYELEMNSDFKKTATLKLIRRRK